MLGFILAAALFGAPDPSDELPCSDTAAQHVAANYSVCAWEPPPPFATSSGTSDYRAQGSAATFLHRPDFDWRLRDRALRRLTEITRSDLGVEKDLFGGYVAGCRTPAAASRLGSDEAGLRSDHAAECWRFLDEEEVRRGGEAE